MFPNTEIRAMPKYRNKIKNVSIVKVVTGIDEPLLVLEP